MRRAVIAGYLVLVVGHGLIHLMGVVDGYGGEVSQLTEPIGPVNGTLWLLAASLVLVSAALVLRRHPSWWAITALAALVSQAAVVTSWSDARAGTAANVLMLLAAGYGVRARSTAPARGRRPVVRLSASGRRDASATRWRGSSP